MCLSCSYSHHFSLSKSPRERTRQPHRPVSKLLGLTLDLAERESRISTSKGETVAGSRGREGRENMAVENKVGWGKLGRSNLIKYPSGIRVNPILEEIDPFVHCHGERSTGFKSERCGRWLRRRFEVKGEDSKWSYLSCSGRGAKESSNRAATRPQNARSTPILPVSGR